MKIVTIRSQNFMPLWQDWFMKTMPPDMEPVTIDSPLDSVPGTGFQSDAWKRALDFKIAASFDYIRDHQGEIFCLSDVDMQFFGPIHDRLLEALGDHDITAMREWCEGGFNCGFMVIRCNDRTAALYQDLEMMDKSGSELYEQMPLNLMLKEAAYGITHSILPDCFWASHRGLLFKEEEPPLVLVNHATGHPDKPGELQRMRELYGPDGYRRAR